MNAPARRHLGFGAVASLTAQLAPLAAMTVLSVVVARRLGPQGTGSVALLTALLEALILLFSVGINSGVTYLVSRGDWGVRSALRQTQRVAATLGLAGVAVGMLFYLLTRHGIFARISLASALIGLVHLPAALGRSFLASLALARQRYEAYAAFELVHSAVILCAGIALTFAFGLIGALIGLAAANFAAWLAAFVWGERFARVVDDQADGSPGRLRAAVSFGVKAWGAGLLQLINYRLDLFLLGAFASRADVGRYSVALSVTALAWVLPSALETVLFPRTADLHGAQLRGEIDLTESDAATARAIRHSVLLLVPAGAIVLLLVLGAIPLLYGSAFARAIGFGLILVPGVLGLSLAKALSAVTTGRGKPEYALWTTAVTVPLTIALYAALIPSFGGYGAAAGSTVSYLASTALALFWFRRATGIPFTVALVPSRRELADYRFALIGARERLRARTG